MARGDSHYQTSYIRRLRAGLLAPACERCGFDDVRALQLDHIDGNGYQKGQKRGGKAAEWVAEKRRRAAGEEPQLQTLCANCNWIKRYENEEWRPNCHA